MLLHCRPGSNKTILVGGFNPSEKYESFGVTIPNIWKNKKCSKPPTRIALDVDIGQKWSKHGQKLIDKNGWV
jgi:hypothetical protein